MLNELRTSIKSADPKLNRTTSLRMVSLRALEAACREALTSGVAGIPEPLRFLAGIQRIQYVFVYPEKNDIVFAGPGEGWTVNDSAAVVGVTTGRPVLRLDDLLVALRTVEQSRLGGISCSIDPTEEGIRAFRNVMDQLRKQPNANEEFRANAIKQAFGNQEVTITGVPATSHFARVLVAADYRMKRLAMNLEPSPVPGLPSYLDMIRNQGATNANPRWWLACNYDPLAASEDRLAWELRGRASRR